MKNDIINLLPTNMNGLTAVSVKRSNLTKFGVSIHLTFTRDNNTYCIVKHVDSLSDIKQALTTIINNL